jgi:broad specificity polyphosphatase/5'/3'-nucleotidase SurE
MPDQVNTDMQAVENNFISISILDYNLTASESKFQSYKEVFTNA